MQAGSSRILHSFYALVTRSLHVEFHTSACALKGGRGSKRKPSTRKNSPKLARSPARKRLVSSLKPDDNKKGIYEVAPREKLKSRDKDAPDHGTNAKKTGRSSTPSRKIKGSARGDQLSVEEDPFIARKRTPVEEKPKFERDEAPHRGRLTSEEIHQSRRRGVDFGLRGSAARRPRYRPEYGGRGLLGRGGDDVARRPGPPAPTHFQNELHTPEFESSKKIISRFTSPPLLDGLLQSVHDFLGPNARPSPIQSLALKHLFAPLSRVHHTGSEERDSSSTRASPARWNQHLLAAETGSGKSIAYLLPMLQHLKLTEGQTPPAKSHVSPHRLLPLIPRGIILAPTHELARQLSKFAKALLYHVRLRVLCTSRANSPSSGRGRTTARQLSQELNRTGFGLTGVGSVGLGMTRPVDVLVGTTTKVLEMVRGLGWDREARIEEQWDEARKERARTWVPGPPEMGLANVEWVVVDEADILFDRDFEASTRLLLADIARARGYSHPSFAELDSAFGKSVPPPSTPVLYPFHITLTSATIPASLASYLSVAHPKMARLASPGLHRLPSTLTTEHQEWTSGNQNADIEKRIQRVWAEDAQSPSGTRSKVLVFCNKSSKVEDLGLYLKEKGIPNVALTSKSPERAQGSNRHLDGFLKNTENLAHPTSSTPETTPSTPHSSSQAPPSMSDQSTMSSSNPHVLITTSLLSRGLDFSPQIRHVFVADPPRNMVDFLHRAGRAGRAGNAGRVVLFGKSKGRGAGQAREVRRQVQAVV